MTASQFRRAVAAALVCSLLSVVTAVPARAQTSAPSGALFGGRVVDKNGFAPRPGVVVTLVDVATERTFPSEPTNDDGVFRIESAPAGTYALLADTPEGRYLATDSFELEEGVNRPLQLALDPDTQPRLVPGQTDDDELPKWAKGLIAGLMLPLGWLLWDNISEDEASKPTPF